MLSSTKYKMNKSDYVDDVSLGDTIRKEGNSLRFLDNMYEDDLYHEYLSDKDLGQSVPKNFEESNDLKSKVVENILKTLPDDSLEYLTLAKKIDKTANEKKCERLIAEKIDFFDYVSKRDEDVTTLIGLFKKSLGLNKKLSEENLKLKEEKNKNYLKYIETKEKLVLEMQEKEEKLNTIKRISLENKTIKEELNDLNRTSKNMTLYKQNSIKIDCIVPKDMNSTPNQPMNISQVNRYEQTLNNQNQNTDRNGYRIEDLKRCTKFSKEGTPNMVYKENRRMFLEPGKTINGERDMRYKQNKERLNNYWRDYYENM